jgi:DNA processing protein
MRIEPVIAMVNDHQDLNERKVLEFFVDLFSEKNPKKITVDIFKDYLKIQKLDNESRYSAVAAEIANRLDQTNLQHYQDYLSRIDNEGIEFVPFYRDEYPERLWSLSDAPLCLYVDGDLSALSEGVAVVGTRDANDHRVEFVQEIAQKLVEMDKTVVSGLAHGVDAAAHEGALDAGGKTVAILPGDVQQIRPSGNTSIGEEIRENGALVGELTDMKSIHKGRFVERNRLTSGISSAVIIGASGETGGTIHQANFAKEQEKPRFLYQPEREDGQSPEKLYKKGFVPFETVDQLEDLLEEKFEPLNEVSEKPTTLDDFQ